MSDAKKEDCPRDEAGFCIGGLWGLCPKLREPDGVPCGREVFNAEWDRRYAELKAAVTRR